MTRPGSPDNPLRVAIVGAGPAGFYALQGLSQRKHLAVQVDMFDRLPAPFGLVRHGVAPDHQKIKSVTAVYHRLALQPGFRFFGNVEYGRDLLLEDLNDFYHQVVFCTGAQTDRKLGIPGEDLAGSHPATDFVAWYNGHPDYCDMHFDLSHQRAVVVGVGNVAVDVARILCRTEDELSHTDIADHALEALRHSRIREVSLLGRRGPAQAAFTNPEIKELGELAGASTSTLAEEVELDPLSRLTVERQDDKATLRKIDLLQSYAAPHDSDKAKRLALRFLVSPVEILDNGSGGISGVRLVKNELYETDDGTVRPRPTERYQILRAGLVFRSVGYRGVPLPGLPFHDRWGVIPNERGRVVDPGDASAGTGIYVSGWIKRGPSGVIGTNKPDAWETVRCMFEDLDAGRVGRPSRPQRQAVERHLTTRGVDFITYPEWIRLDEMEIQRGESRNRPRVKFVRREEFLRALGR